MHVCSIGTLLWPHLCTTKWGVIIHELKNIFFQILLWNGTISFKQFQFFTNNGPYQLTSNRLAWWKDGRMFCMLDLGTMWAHTVIDPLEFGLLVWTLDCIYPAQSMATTIIITMEIHLLYPWMSGPMFTCHKFNWATVHINLQSALLESFFTKWETPIQWLSRTFMFTPASGFTLSTLETFLH